MKTLIIIALFGTIGWLLWVDSARYDLRHALETGADKVRTASSAASTASK